MSEAQTAEKKRRGLVILAGAVLMLFLVMLAGPLLGPPVERAMGSGLRGMTGGLEGLWTWLEYSPVGDFVAVSAWAFPALESAHVIGVVTVVGCIMIMDLRLLGVASNSCSVTELSSDTLPWTWGAFALAVITGLALFASNASGYTANTYFLWKMVLIVLAGINMAVFHFFTWKSVHSWNIDCQVPRAGKIAGALSLAFWILVVTCGRWIGFTLGGFMG